jgi:hypothetical protein
MDMLESKDPGWSGKLNPYLGLNQLISQFSRMSDRQIGLWDTSSLTNLNMESVDTSS